MIKTYSLVLLAITLLFLIPLKAQENHYWFFNFGAVSSLKGGVETAGIRNVGAAYYNPGALAFIGGEYVEIQADVISFDAFNIKNAGGDDINLSYFTTDIAPSIVAYLKRLKNKPRITYTVGFLTRYNSNFNYFIEHEEVGNYLSPDTREDVFQGQYKYDNRIREGWLMGSFAYRLSEKIGIGLGSYLFVRTQDYLKGYKAIGFPLDELGDPHQRFSALTSNDEEEKFSYRSLGFIFKPGIDIELDDLRLGLTLTTPAISLGLLNNYAFKSQISYLPDVNVFVNASDSHDVYSAVYKTPFSVNFGAEYNFEKWVLSFSAEWFSKVGRYEMLKKNGNSIDPDFPSRPDESYAIPVMAHKSVTNFGFSVRYNIKEWISYIGSFRTDFNYFDDEALDRNQDFVPSFTFWDVHHITSGIKMSRKRINLTTGIDYGFGNSKGDPQFVSMTSASQSNFLRGNIENNTSTNYHNFSLTLGINLNIDERENGKSKN